MNISEDFPNFYEILEVSPNAGEAVIRAAYKSLMQRYHPDKNAGDPQKARETILIGQAFEILSDPKTRAAYDLQVDRNKSAQSAPNANQYRTQLVTPLRHQDGPPTEHKVVNTTQTTNESAYALPLLGFILIIFFLAATVFGKQPTSNIQAPTQAMLDNAREQQEKLNSDNAAKAAADKAKLEQSRIERTMPKFVTGFTAKMPPTDGGYSYCSIDACRHYVEIPELWLVVKSSDTEKIRLHLLKNKKLITQELVKRLGSVEYTFLLSVDGETKLTRILVEQINKTIVGSSFSEAGVEDVLLPGSFTVH